MIKMNWKEEKWKEIVNKVKEITDYYNFKDRIKIYIDNKNEYKIEQVFDNLMIEYQYIDTYDCEIFKETIDKKDGIIIINPLCSKKYKKNYDFIKDIPEAKENLVYFIVDDLDHTNFMSEIFPLLYYRISKQWYVPCIQTTITTRCTLKCKDCGNGCNHWDRNDKSNDLPFEKVKESIDNIYRKADFIDRIHLLGGEVFLCQDVLIKIFSYIAKTYQNMYRRITIYTNGTIQPTKDFIEALKIHNVHIFISDYTFTVPWIKRSINDLCNTLQENGISHYCFRERIRWYDYKIYDTIKTDEEAEEINKKCIIEYPYLRCPEIIGNKAYTCNMAYSTMICKRINTETENYLDINSITNIEYAIKYTKGLVDNIITCKYCNGYSEDNRILCGIQE